jgi:hypothetical protein
MMNLKGGILMSDNNPLKPLYGEEVMNLVIKEIDRLAKNSNFTFDREYVLLGMSFMGNKAREILNGEKQKPSLESLVNESFGEAAIFKFQC